jgi:hypothetical protein
VFSLRKSDLQSLLGRIANATVGRITSAVVNGRNQMILPDDRAPSIKWDMAAQRWVGAGVDNGTTDVPPPTTTGSTASVVGAGGAPPSSSGAGLTAARRSGGSRYFNQLATSESATPNSATAAAALPLSVPSPQTFYGFIPQPAVDDQGQPSEATSPFSVHDPVRVRFGWTF